MKREVDYKRVIKERRSELEQRIKECKDLPTCRKLIALRLLKGGHQVTYAAKIAGVDRRTVQRCMKDYRKNENGLEGLLAGGDAKRNPYHQPFAKEEDLIALREAVIAGKVTTYKEARDFLENERNIVYKDAGSVFRLMQKNNMLIKDLLPARARRKARAGRSGETSA